MNANFVLNSVYFNAMDSNEDKDWVYYRLASIGADGDPITICQLRWPTFEDIDSIFDEHKAVITTPGVTGGGTTYARMCLLLKNKWNVDHPHSTLIGFLEK